MKLLSKLSAAALVFIAVGTLLLRAQDTSVHQVVGITGKWYWVDGNNVEHKLRFGEMIDPKISCVVGDGDGLPVLAVTIRGTPVRLACEGKPECERPVGRKCARRIMPPASGTDSSTALSLAAEFIAMFQEPDRYVTPVSRGLEPHLLDAVVVQEGENVDFAPAFVEMESGSYKIRIEPLLQKGPPLEAQVEWTGKAPASNKIPILRPGLYRLVRLNSQSEPAEPGGAWVLVDTPDRFSRDSASFRSAEEETKTWTDDVDPRVPRAVLRAYLDSLAKNKQPAH